MSRVAARCPSCQSVFFVSAAQGVVANNLVRCGRCGHLFSVLDNLTASQPEPETVQSPSLSAMAEELKPGLDVEPVSEGGRAGLPTVQLDEFAELIIPPVTEMPKSESYAGDRPAELSFTLPNVTLDLPDDFTLTSPAAPAAGLRRSVALALFIISFALIGLVGQLVFFKLPALSQEPGYRPWLLEFCGLLSCELAAYTEPGLVRVEHLQVRAHPDLEAGLLVELVLTNTAHLEQAFPALILSFDDLSGRQIAARRLVAAEYLPKSFVQAGPMPINKAVSIRLGILDPGARALSYAVVVEQ
ncbi:hypothetical protein A9Q90_03130 [Gammaproteobacteria bacterium 54_18_T64]|nr:hypothetical protein A9Q90_03130 [Gammaproteobacteria bacterium 54_18_T64]